MDIIIVSGLVFNVRCLTNPHWQPEFRPLTGKDPVIIDYLQQNEDVEEMVQQLGGFLTRWLPMLEAENRSNLSVGIGCTSSRHRSVYIVNRLVTTFRGPGPTCTVASPGSTTAILKYW